jgi:oxygen-independent coproporphyrinogen-3 oxidase
MGIQSFHDNELKLLGRRHTGKEALDAVNAIKKAGFSNFNLDLIYGIPNSDLISWEKNLETIIKLQPNHISSYCLTIESGTQLDYQVKKKRVVLPSENVVISQFEALMDNLVGSKYDHYEISNFALKGFESKHNTSYWQGTSYLGLGPSAHSFNGINRKINIANTNKYCDLLKDDKGFEWEYLSETDRFNEFIMTGLRTKWGIDLDFIQESFPDSFILQLKIELENPIKNSLLLLKNSNVVLTQKGKLFADKIASDLFRVS